MLLSISPHIIQILAISTSEYVLIPCLPSIIEASYSADPNFSESSCPFEEWSSNKISLIASTLGKG